MSNTFKNHLIIEGRREDLTYLNKVVKNKIDRVTVELSGSDSGSMTRLAARYDRLSKAIDAMSKKKDELNVSLKDKVTELFDAEDEVLTRVVETVQFTMTLSKRVKVEDQEPKKVVNYEKIAEELAKLIPDELQAQVQAITEAYTETKIAAEKAPALRVVGKVNEDALSQVRAFFATLGQKLTKFIQGVRQWGTGYDAKLRTLEADLNRA